MVASANSQGNRNNFFINVEDKNIRLENVENFIFDYFKIEKENMFIDRIMINSVKYYFVIQLIEKYQKL